jgi:hypothetical protein
MRPSYRRVYALLPILLALVAGCGGDSEGEIPDEGPGGAFQVASNPGRHTAFDAFEKFVDVLGLSVYATGTTPDDKVVHAANVLAQYLDNDADGYVDNVAAHRELLSRSASLVMFATEDEARSHSVWEALPDDVAVQDLYGEETHPGGAEDGVFDASLEEVLHLITHVGYAHAYPEVFGERPGTRVADAMDKARGGRFVDVPDAYPDGAWYSYDDETCNYGCQVTEYMYWAITSLLGAQDFEGRPEQIANEWRLPTPDAVRDRDRDVYRILSDPKYRFPRRLPDGEYRVTPVW